MIVKPVILCGGAGTRLWPLSTPAKPKQFQALTSHETMLELTAGRLQARVEGGPEIAQSLVIGSSKHETLLCDQMPDARLILEPTGRNSAPAIAAACLVSNPSEYLLILPADHHIGQPDKFLDAIATAMDAAASGSLVTFGIHPTHPATGYGYIRGESGKTDIVQVEEFIEKPPIDKAQAYISSGNYYWNAGIFLFKVSSMLAAFEKYAPDIIVDTRKAITEDSGQVVRLEPAAFASVRDISIDYAIMEHESDIKVVPVDMGWSDVGGYDALWEMLASDATSNASIGPTITDASSGSFVRSDGPLICVSGLSDMAVIANDDVVMVAPRSDDDAIKRLGKAAQAGKDANAVSAESSEIARTLLWDSFALWGKLAWDPEHGGFVEELDMKGRPVPGKDRRVRVQARQVFSFAQSLILGYEDMGAAAAHVSNGIEYLTSVCRHPEGGWIHRIAPNGVHLDTVRDLYDHAFIMLAGAAAFEATMNNEALELAEDALAYIDSEFLDVESGGYRDNSNKSGARRANPHMHLLEAFLALYQATRERRYLDRASNMVLLFERHFFEPGQNILIEHFLDDWSPASDEAGTSFEPGHHYEWASLLKLHSRATGRDNLSWCRRLIAAADAKGPNAGHGFAYNKVAASGAAIDDGSRLWHQLEKFRARVLFPGSAVPGAADSHLRSIKASYFDPIVKGAWIDELSAEANVKSTAVPASMLYHLVTALSPVLRDAG